MHLARSLFHHSLAHSVVSVGPMAHRLVNLNPTEVDRYQCWRGAGVDQDCSVPPGPNAWLPQIGMVVVNYLDHSATTITLQNSAFAIAMPYR